MTCPLTLMFRGADAATTAVAVSDRLVPREAMLEPSPVRLVITCSIKMARLKSISPNTRMSIIVAEMANSTSAWPELPALVSPRPVSSPPDAILIASLAGVAWRERLILKTDANRERIRAILEELCNEGGHELQAAGEGDGYGVSR